MLKKGRDDALEELNTLKGYVLTLEGKNKELAKLVEVSSCDAKEFHKEVTSLRATCIEALKDVARLSIEKENTDKKETKLVAALKSKEDELSKVISESKSMIAHLTEDRDKAVQNDKDIVVVAKVVGEECFNNAIELIFFLNPVLEIKTEGMGIILNIVGGQMVEKTTEENADVDIEGLLFLCSPL